MSSLEDLTPEQQEQAVRLYSFVKQNPDVEKQIRREAKKKNPNMSAPDIDLEDALEKQRNEIMAELEKDRKAQTEALQAQRRKEAHDRIKSQGFDPDEVEKIMVDQNIGNYDTAVNYIRGQQQLAPATPESVTPMSLPESKDLWSNKNKFARDTAFAAINDLKAGRAFSR